MKGNPATPIREYALEQTSDLLRRMAFQATRTSKHASPDAIHDLRVSIRRLTQCLALFDQFFSGGEAKKVRRKARVLMDLASQVRNCDIALDLLKRAAVPAASPMARAILRERRQSERALEEALKRWSRRDAHRKWRLRLDL